MKDIFKIIEDVKKQDSSSALCIIVSTSGSTPLKAGAKMLITDKGDIHGTIGGGNFEKKVIENAKESILKKESGLYNHNLVQQHAMCCGGTVSVYIEFIMKPEKLYIFGSGHVGRALAKLAVSLPFDVYVIDNRLQELNQITDEGINKISLPYTEILPHLPFNENTYIAVMTYDHQIDRELLAYCIKKDFAYLGMIGSSRKIEITKKMFLSTHLLNEDDFNKVDSPMGIDINAEIPEEIAISIMAKLIEVKNKRNKRTSKAKNKSTTQVKHENS